MAWPTSNVAVAGTTIPESDHNELRADIISANGFVRKTADESVTSSAVLQNDDHLLHAINDAAGTYLIDVYLIGTSAANAAGDLNVGFTFPTGTFYFGGSGPDAALASGSLAQTQWGGAGSVTSGAALASYGLSTSAVFIRLHGLFIATATGTLRLQWCQAVSNANASTLKAGSHMTVRQVA